jgi:hypothetical protein
MLVILTGLGPRADRRVTHRFVEMLRRDHPSIGALHDPIMLTGPPGKTAARTASLARRAQSVESSPGRWKGLMVGEKSRDLWSCSLLHE